MAYWLMKSEPGAFAIADLERAVERRSVWDGVRNYQARNFLRQMRFGDEAAFYHSGGANPGIGGRMRIAREAFPDPTQFDPRDPHYDPGSRRDTPRWFAVEVAFVERFPALISLRQMRAERGLDGLLVLRRGNRLSVTPVLAGHWKLLLSLANSVADAT